MSLAELLLPEFEQEMAGTRKVLERIPEDKLELKAHPKSASIGWVANHLAEIPGWVAGTVTSESWDINPPGGEPYQSPTLTSRAEILKLFDQNVAEAKEGLKTVSDEELSKSWSLLAGGQPLFTLPKYGVIRSFVLNHTIHHRGHLCVYLRLNELPVPGLYGPSADEQT